jgi:hypothetical protein
MQGCSQGSQSIQIIANRIKIFCIILTTGDLAPKDNELVLREIHEIREALEAFNAAVEIGEITGFKDDGLRAD